MTTTTYTPLQIIELENALLLRGSSWWAHKAQEEDAIGRDEDAICALVISRQFEHAVNLGITLLRKNLRDATCLSDAVKNVLKYLKFVPAVRLDKSLRSTFLCYILWFSAHEAAELGYWETGASQLRYNVQSQSSRPCLNTSSVLIQY